MFTAVFDGALGTLVNIYYEKKLLLFNDVIDRYALSNHRNKTSNTCACPTPHHYLNSSL